MWLSYNTEVFVRNLLRDFCEVYAALVAQNSRFSTSGSVSYAVLRDLLGREMRQGVFWRLKDTAHHLFRTQDPSQAMERHLSLLDEASLDTARDTPQQHVETLLDWCIGYAFHECTKLKEDAFQQQHYANSLTQLKRKLTGYDEVLHDLTPLLTQTRESIGREMSRILHVLGVAKTLLINYLQAHKNNAYVARYLVAEHDHVRAVFDTSYTQLTQALYGDAPVQCQLIAAKAWLEVGRPQQAAETLDSIQQRATLSSEHATQLQELYASIATFAVTQPTQEEHAHD